MNPVSPTERLAALEERLTTLTGTGKDDYPSRIIQYARDVIQEAASKPSEQREVRCLA
jgi:hypothetical protein